MDLKQLCNIAIEAAHSTGQIIQEFTDKDVVVKTKTEGTSYRSQVVTEVDKKCEAVILSHLIPTCKEHQLALVSEESEDDQSRFEKDYFWCIDPLDGTLPFINRQTGFAVSIALVAKDGTPQIGVVYDPSAKTLYHAIKDGGAFKNNNLWNIEQRNNHLTYVTDRALKDTANSSTIEKLIFKNKEQLNIKELKEISGGGSVLNAIRVLENGPAMMLKLPKKENGGGSIWDFAATACIFNELGKTATNYNGEKLDLNRKDGTFMNHEGIVYSNL